MADYIYLFQNRLTPAQRNALEAVRDVARGQGMPVFLTGGAARDLTTGTPVRDLDFVVQGEVVALIGELQARGAKVSGQNPVFSSTFLIFPGGVRAEVGPTLTVSYPKPGVAETQPAAILDDLRHRDFTANAMAISLNEGSYGLLLDPTNGVADIENRELRLVSNYGFIEQPALLLRAARLAGRLGWTLEERTQVRYNTAKEENYIASLPERDRGYELEEIFYEEDPLSTLDQLSEEGWGHALYPALTSSKSDREGLERIRDLMGQLDGIGIHVDPAPVFFPLVTAKLTPPEMEGLKHLFIRPGFASQIESLDSRSKELAGQLTAKSASAPSESWKILFSAEPEVVLWLAYSARVGSVQAKFKAFLNDWPQMRQRVPYTLMQEMRISPDLPGYEKLLEDLFFALIDGKLDTVEATRAFLEPYSPPAPVVPSSPRRRPAKATRSRARKPAEVSTPATPTVSTPEDLSSQLPVPSAGKLSDSPISPRKSSKAANVPDNAVPIVAAIEERPQAVKKTAPEPKKSKASPVKAIAVPAGDASANAPKTSAAASMAKVQPPTVSGSPKEFPKLTVKGNGHGAAIPTKKVLSLAKSAVAAGKHSSVKVAPPPKQAGKSVAKVPATKTKAAPASVKKVAPRSAPAAAGKVVAKKVVTPKKAAKKSVRPRR